MVTIPISVGKVTIALLVEPSFRRLAHGAIWFLTGQILSLAYLVNVGMRFIIEVVTPFEGNINCCCWALKYYVNE